MHSAAFDPGALASHDDPYAALAGLRSVASVCEVDGGVVAVTGYAAVLDALRHPGCRSGPIGDFYRGALPPGAARDEMSNRINFLDPPDHHRVRQLVNRAFTPRRVAELRPWMEGTAETLLDEAGAGSEVDVLTQVAHQLPSLVISELLGVPPVDRDLLTGFSDATAPLLAITVEPDARARAIDAAEHLHHYLGALLDERAAVPTGDLLSSLVTSESDGDRLTRPELLSLAATLYSAGHRTTRDLVTNGLAVLLADGGERWTRFVAGAWPVDRLVEEMLRFETPTLYVARVTAEDVELDGVAVPAGAMLLLFLAAANRDPAAYADPDRFDPDREGPSALSFAFGAHHCLGAALARAEAAALLEVLARRWPAMELLEPPTWHLRGPFRGVDRLLVAPGIAP